MTHYARVVSINSDGDYYRRHGGAYGRWLPVPMTDPDELLRYLRNYYQEWKLRVYVREILTL